MISFILGLGLFLILICLGLFIAAIYGIVKIGKLVFRQFDDRYPRNRHFGDY